MARELERKTPEEYLRAAQAIEGASRRGYLKIFLGYASGGGKSYRMLDEARRRRERGQDVVIGGIQRKVTPEIAPLLDGLEVISLKREEGGLAIDVETLIRRRPAVCFIDGLAYNNPPEAANPTRWQDVEALLAAGIKVIGSVNIQYVAELGDQVEAITGKRASETVPMAFLRGADEIEVVDAPPDPAVDRQAQWSRLRELALVLAADVVDRQLLDYLDEHGIARQPGAHEQILVCLTPRANAREMMETASLIAARFHAGLSAAYVSQPEISPADAALLEDKLETARRAGAAIELLEGDDPVGAILEYARTHGVTQLFIGHSQRAGLGPRLWGNPVERLIRNAGGMDIRIFPQ